MVWHAFWWVTSLYNTVDEQKKAWGPQPFVSRRSGIIETRVKNRAWRACLHLLSSKSLWVNPVYRSSRALSHRSAYKHELYRRFVFPSCLGNSFIVRLKRLHYLQWWSLVGGMFVLIWTISSWSFIGGRALLSCSRLRTRESASNSLSCLRLMGFVVRITSGYRLRNNTELSG